MRKLIRTGMPVFAVMILLLGVLLAYLLLYNGPSSGSSSAQPASSSPVTVTVWAQDSGDQRQASLSASIERFNRSQSAIHIVPYFYKEEQYKAKLKVAMVSGKMPDLFYYWFGRSFKYMVDSGRVADLTDRIDRHPDFRNRFYPDALQKATYDDRIYGVPHSTYHVIVWYNRRIFEENGLKPPATWEEMMEIVRKLNASGITPIAVAGKERWPLLNWFAYLSNRIGGNEPFERVLNGQGDFTDPSFVEAGMKLRELVDNNAFIPGFSGMNVSAVEEAFLAGKAAMYLQGDWSSDKLLRNEEIGYFRFPDLGGKGKTTNYYGGYGAGWAIASNGHEDAAFQVLDFLLSPQEWAGFVAASGSPPTMRDLPIAESGIRPAVLKYVQFIQSDPTGYFGYYDQELEPRRAQMLLDGVLKMAYAPRMSREEIIELLGRIR